MECKKCKKERVESELINGYCVDCIKDAKGDEIKIKKNENKIAEAFKTGAACIIAINIVLATAIFAIDQERILTLILLIVAGFVIAGFSRATSEIIQLLEDIKNK